MQVSTNTLRYILMILNFQVVLVEMQTELQIRYFPSIVLSPLICITHANKHKSNILLTTCRLKLAFLKFDGYNGESAHLSKIPYLIRGNEQSTCLSLIFNAFKIWKSTMFLCSYNFLTSSHLTLGLTVLSLSGMVFWYQCRFIKQILELLWNFNVFPLLCLESAWFLVKFLLKYFLWVSKAKPYFSQVFSIRACGNLLYVSFFLTQTHCTKIWWCCKIFALLKILY